MNLPLLRLWAERERIIYFSKLNLKLRFKGTQLGLVWAVLEPLLMFSILYIVFSTIRNSNQEFFGIYLITGVMLYQLFSRGTMMGLTSLNRLLLALNYLVLVQELARVVERE